MVNGNTDSRDQGQAQRPKKCEVKMIQAINQEAYSGVRPLFQGLTAYQPMCAAVLAGVYPGKVFVDDPRHPKSAFLSTFIHAEASGVWGFLAGNPLNLDFNQALNRAIFGREIVSAAAPVLLITCDPQDWAGVLEQVTAPLAPIPFPRQYYTCRELKYDWRPDLPQGFSIQPIDETFLTRTDLNLPGEVQEIAHKWFGKSDVKLKDFGFTAIYENQVVSWATIDFISNGAGDAGLFTLEDYRRRGLAAITTAAAMEYGFSQGLEVVHWTCDEDNRGSIRTAEKLGFQRGADYRMYYIIFDEAQHFGALAYQHLTEAEYQQAVDAFARAFQASPDHPSWVYFHAARAYACLNDDSQAVQSLSRAVDKGWNDIPQTQNCEEFKRLKDLPEWEGILKAMS